MTKILLTGASGFIAKHILRELLEQGYEVRATVRSDKRKAEIEAIFPDASIEFSYLDLMKDEGWDEALAGVDVLMHTASPFPLGEPKNPDDVIRPAVDGTLRAMNAAKAAGVKRVILTSSCVAIYKDSAKAKEAISNEENWTDVELAAVSTYEKSKTMAERAAWDFARENPEIKLTTINPGLVAGPAMDQNYGTSLELVERILNGKNPMQPPLTMPIVDVRDVAKLHVNAIKLKASQGERFAANAEAISLVEIAEVLKAEFPDRKISTKEAPIWMLRLMSVFMPELKQIIAGLGYNLDVSNAKAKQAFGIEFIPSKEAVLASARFLLEKN